MSNYNLDQVSLFYLQILLSSSFIATILISISLSYNEILKIQHRKPIYDYEMENKILLFNRSLSVLIAIGFLWLNVQDKKTIPEDKQDIKYANLQIDASILSLLGSLIVLYVAFDSINDVNSNDFDNPAL